MIAANNSIPKNTKAIAEPAAIALKNPDLP